MNLRHFILMRKITNITSSIDLEEDYGSIASINVIVGVRVMILDQPSMKRSTFWNNIYKFSGNLMACTDQTGEVKFDIIEAFVLPRQLIW